jgi:hypothetical protein
VLSKTSQPAIRQLRNEPNHVHGIEQARGIADRHATLSTEPPDFMLDFVTESAP